MKRLGDWDGNRLTQKKNEGVGMRWRIPNDDNRGPKVQTSRYEAMGTDKRTSDVQTLGEKTLGSTT